MQRIHELLDRAKDEAPEAQAFVDQSGLSVTWSVLDQMARECEEEMRAEGVGVGDRVVLVFENGITFVARLFAASRLGAVVVPFNARLSAADLQRVMDHCAPRLLWFSGSKAADRHAERLGAVGGIYVPDAASKPQTLEALSDQNDTIPPEDVAVLVYTSGTTGAAKAAMLTHTNLLAGSEASAVLRGLRSDDLFFIVAPMAHVLGLVAMLAVCNRRASALIHAVFDVARLFEELQNGVTTFSGPPQMHALLFEHAERPDTPAFSAPRLRVVASGGAPLDPDWKRKAESFYGLPMQNGYGLTETSAGVCSTNSQLGDPDLSVGLAMHGSALRIDFDRSGAEPEHGIGEICVQGPQVMHGYYRNEDETRKCLTEDGWFYTGDLGRFDDEGRLHIVGRSKALIIRSGFNVYPAEVEAALTLHPQITNSAVVGRSVPGNEEIVAFLETKENVQLSPQTIRDWLTDRLTAYKFPQHYYFVEKLPLTSTGKVDRVALQERAAAN